MIMITYHQFTLVNSMCSLNQPVTQFIWTYQNSKVSVKATVPLISETHSQKPPSSNVKRHILSSLNLSPGRGSGGYYGNSGGGGGSRSGGLRGAFWWHLHTLLVVLPMLYVPHGLFSFFFYSVRCRRAALDSLVVLSEKVEFLCKGIRQFDFCHTLRKCLFGFVESITILPEMLRVDPLKCATLG